MLSAQQVRGFINSQIPFLDFPGVRQPFISSFSCGCCGLQMYTLRCCRSTWCPICNFKQAAKLNYTFQYYADFFLKAYKPLFLTLTFKNVPVINREIIKKYREFFTRKFLRSKLLHKNTAGGVYAFDYTWSYNTKDPSWNMHLHVLLFSRAFIPVHDISSLWYRITKDSYVVHIKHVPKFHYGVSEVIKYIESNKAIVNIPNEKKQELFDTFNKSKRFSKFGACYKLKVPKKKAVCKKCKANYFDFVSKDVGVDSHYFVDPEKYTKKKVFK